MNEEKLLKEALRLFPDNLRPLHFTNYLHCEECKDHDDVLSAHTRESITYKELGNAVWDPIAFINEKGFKYYFPALVRLALYGKDEEYYIDQLLFHLNENKNCNLFNKEESLFVINLLSFLKDNRYNEIELNMDLEELEKALLLWKRKRTHRGRP
ncbi:MAG: hypothetical protein AB1724_14745 [Thermodesulfobacteriota bacterium]